MMRRKSRGRRRASVVVVMLILSTVLLHAAIEAHPVWRRTIERSLERERSYRAWRMNEAIGRFERTVGHKPRELEDLVAERPGGVFLPRVYCDPSTERVEWQLERDAGGALLSVAPLARKASDGVACSGSRGGGRTAQ